MTVIAYGILLEHDIVDEHYDVPPSSHFVVGSKVILGIKIRDIEETTFPANLIPRKLSVLQEAQYQETLDSCPGEFIAHTKEQVPQFYILTT